MASAAFLRAVNVGGRTLRARAFAEALGLHNIGAAGTFVSRGPARGLAQLIRAELPFETEVMVCSAARIAKLVESAPFPNRGTADRKHYVTILGRAPREVPELPLVRPGAHKWQVRLLAVDGVFALSTWQRRPAERLVYPNAVVEHALGVPATTRGWDTILRVHAALRS